MHNVEKKISKSIIFQFLNVFFSGLVGLIFIPFIIKKLGADQYGLFEIVFSLNVINAVLDIGVGSTLVNYTNKYFKQGIEEFGGFFWSYFWLKLFLSILGAILCIVIAFFLPNIFSKVPFDQYEIIRISIYWFAIGVILNNLNSFLASVQNGFVRFDLSSIAAIFSKLFYLVFFFIWWYLWEINTIEDFSFITFILVPLIKLLIQVFQIGKILPSELRNVKWFRKQYVLETLSYLKGISVITIFAQFFNYGSQALLSVLAPPEVVGEFGILKRIMGLVQTVSSMVIRPIMPAANSLREKYSISRIVLSGTQIHAIIVIGMSLLLVLNAEFINKFYLNSKFQNFNLSMFLINLQLLLPTFSIMLMLYYNEGLVKMSVECNILNTIVSLVFAYFGFKINSFLGFLAGMSFGYLLVMLWQTFRFLKLYEINKFKFFRIYIIQYGICIFASVLSISLIKKMGVSLLAFISINITTIVLIVFLSWLGIDKPNRLLLQRKFKIKLKK